jgi:hypothetical protein
VTPGQLLAASDPLHADNNKAEISNVNKRIEYRFSFMLV